MQEKSSGTGSVSGRVALVMPRSLATQPERVQSRQDANDRQVCCGQIVERLHYVLACELLAAAQAVDLLGGPGDPTRSVARLGAGTRAAYEVVREVAGFLDEDRILAPEVERVRDLVSSGELLARVDAVVSTGCRDVGGRC